MVGTDHTSTAYAILALTFGYSRVKGYGVVAAWCCGFTHHGNTDM